MSLSSAGAGGLPSPPSVDQIVASFAGPAYGLVPQRHLQEFAATVGSATGRAVHVSLSYSFFRVPDRLADPVNFVELTPDQQDALDRTRASNLPGWLKDQIMRMRYPVLFEAVRTSIPIPAERAHPLESRLAAHMLDTLHATQPHRATTESAHWGSLPPFQEGDIERGVPVLVDGEPLRGFRIDSHPDVVAIGVRVGNSYLTAIIPREVLPSLNLAFARR